MQQATQQRLLALNRDFYHTVADEFDSTRLYVPAGMYKALEFAAALGAGGSPGTPLSVLDVGCGNARFAWALDTLAHPVEYTGVDLNARLLELAGRHATQLQHVQPHFVCADLSQPDWTRRLIGRSSDEAISPFDLVACFATLHHFPGYSLRQRIVNDLAALLNPGGLLILSNWQMLSSQRFVEKQIDWATLAVDVAELEAGDVLLPWNQRAQAVRYIHQIDEDEVQRLAQSANFRVVHTYRIDGKEGNLNLYAVFEKWSKE